MRNFREHSIPGANHRFVTGDVNIFPAFTLVETCWTFWLEFVCQTMRNFEHNSCFQSSNNRKEQMHALTTLAGHAVERSLTSAGESVPQISTYATCTARRLPTLLRPLAPNLQTGEKTDVPLGGITGFPFKFLCVVQWSALLSMTIHHVFSHCAQNYRANDFATVQTAGCEGHCTVHFKWGKKKFSFISLSDVAHYLYILWKFWIPDGIFRSEQLVIETDVLDAADEPWEVAF